MFLLPLLATIGLGADAPLAVQHGRLALELGEPTEAVALARTALDDPEGRQLLYDGLTAAGMAARALVELEAVPEVERPWKRQELALRAALDAGDPAAIAPAAKALADGFPEHPELLVPLFDDPAPPFKLRRQRDRMLEQTKQALDRRREDPVYAWRARAMFLAAGWPLDMPEEVLGALGEPEAPGRRARSLPERAVFAQELTKAAVALPEGIRSEQADLVDRAAEVAFAEHRYDDALAWWNLLDGPLDGVEALEGRARALVALERAMDAVDAVDQGMAWVADPWPDDAAGLASARRASALIRLLDVRADALEAGNHPIAALADKATADLLAGRTETSALEDRVRTIGLSAADSLKATYRAPAGETALAKAEAALIAGEHEDAAKHATAAIFLFAWSDPGDWRVDCARAHAVQARAMAALDQPSAARLAWAVALLLRPEAPADWWLDAAELHERAGHRELALSQYATAQARSEEPLQAPIADLVVGAAEPASVASAMAIPVPVHAAKKGVRVQRGEVYRFNTAAPVGAGDVARGRPPGVGERMPAWKVQTSAGPIASAELHGRAVVLLFWVARCETCLQALQQAGPVARDLRESGRDVAVVAVSMDEEQRYVETLRELQRSRVTMAHDPALGYRLGVERAPTTWIIDPAGTVRYVGVGWHGAAVFERALRRALQE